MIQQQDSWQKVFHSPQFCSSTQAQGAKVHLVSHANLMQNPTQSILFISSLLVFSQCWQDKKKKLGKATSENMISFITEKADKGLQIRFTILFEWNIKFHQAHYTGDRYHVLECHSGWCNSEEE